jgi:hypothetical protein
MATVKGQLRSDVMLALEHVTAQELRVQGARRTMALHNQLADNTATTRSTEVRTLQHLEASMAELQSMVELQSRKPPPFQQRQQCETAIERLHAIIQEDREQRLRSESLFERMLADDVAAFRKDLLLEGDERRAKEEMLGRLASEVAMTVRAELAQERRSRHDVLAHLDVLAQSRSPPRRSPPRRSPPGHRYEQRQHAKVLSAGSGASWRVDAAARRVDPAAHSPGGGLPWRVDGHQTHRSTGLEGFQR